MKNYGPFALRIGVGGLFVITGIMKLMNPAVVTSMLDNLGFPGPLLWAWILILAELLCGAAVLTGYRVKWAVIPLTIILVIAIAVNLGSQTMNALKDMALLAGLVSLWFSGPGTMALSKR